MLLAALGATVIGFILLIVALVTGTLWLAIACVVVSVLGVGLLLGDVLTYRRDKSDKSAKADGDDAWTPGDGAVDDAEAEGDEAPVDGDAAVDDATREAATVGHEEFGHHDGPDAAAETSALAMGPLDGPSGWDHESPADTDDETVRGLFAPGQYDPDMTDQIPQIRIEQAWGTEWTPAREPESDDPDKK